MRANGFACDQCKTFAVSPNDRDLPKGWMTITVSVPREVSANAAVNVTFHICSNKCLRDLGTARWRAEREIGGAEVTNGLAPSTTITSSGKREYSDEARLQMRQNGLRIQHQKGNHAEANPDCRMCQQELQMTAEDITELLRQGQ